jgi:DNA-binding transcriptional regulator YiaG
MPNIAAVLKSEIARIARKEVKGAVAVLKRTVSAQRSQIAALKKQTAELEQRLRRSSKASRNAQDESGSDDALTSLRFSAKGLAAQRKRLGLSAHDVGLLFGTSGQTIYHWESGKARPRSSHMPAIAAMRKLGRREAAAILAQRRG